MNLKVKKLHKDAVIYKPAKDGDAGYDIGFVSHSQDGIPSGLYDEHGNLVYYTGLAIEMPVSPIPNTTMTAFCFPKSSISKKDLFLTNSVGTVDFGYRGEISAKFKHTGNISNIFKQGESICQLIFMPVFNNMDIEFVDELSKTDRGTKSYGEATNERKK